MKQHTNKHIITLTDQEKRALRAITCKGRHAVRTVKRASILLKSSSGWSDDRIATMLSVSPSTVERVRYRFAEGGLDRALYDAPRSGAPQKITDADEAHLIAIACTDPPEGHTHWTLDLLRTRLKRDRKTEVTGAAIWARLTERGLKPWREKNVVHSAGR